MHRNFWFTEVFSEKHLALDWVSALISMMQQEVCIKTLLPACSAASENLASTE
jgi:hypothetical protein